MAIGKIDVMHVSTDALMTAIDNVRTRCGLRGASSERINAHILDKLVKLVMDAVGRELLKEANVALGIQQAQMDILREDFGYLIETDTDEHND